MAEIVSIATSFAHSAGLPPLLVLAVIAGESTFNPWAVAGPNVGLLQINTSVWGGSLGYWGGIAGLERSLWHMLPRWQSVPLAGWEEGFAYWWAAAQGADLWGCIQRAPEALALAWAAWETYGPPY